MPNGLYREFDFDSLISAGADDLAVLL